MLCLMFTLSGPKVRSISCSNDQIISDQCGVLLEVERGENAASISGKISSCLPQNKRYGSTNFPQGNFASWASNGCCVKEIWNRFKEIVFERIDRFVPHKILRRKILILNITIKT